jgi:hypothetical protein
MAGSAEDVARHQLQQAGNRARVAQLAQRRHRRELQPKIGVEQADEGGHRLDGVDVAQRLDGGLGDVAVGVIEQRQQRLLGRGVVDERQDLHGAQGDLGVGVEGELQQVGHGVGALPSQRREGGVAEDGVVVVAEQGAQGLGIQVPRGQGDGLLAHQGGGVAQGLDDGPLGVAAADRALEGGDALGSLGDHGAAWRESRCAGGLRPTALTAGGKGTLRGSLS